MTLPKESVSDLPFSLKKSWELVCLSTARSLLQTLPRRLITEPFVRQVQVPIFVMKGQTTEKARIFLPRRTPKILGKGGKTLQRSKEFLAREKEKEQGRVSEGVSERVSEGF